MAGSHEPRILPKAVAGNIGFPRTAAMGNPSLLADLGQEETFAPRRDRLSGRFTGQHLPTRAPGQERPFPDWVFLPSGWLARQGQQTGLPANC